MKIKLIITDLGEAPAVPCVGQGHGQRAGHGQRVADVFKHLLEPHPTIGVIRFWWDGTTPEAG